MNTIVYIYDNSNLSSPSSQSPVVSLNWYREWAVNLGLASVLLVLGILMIFSIYLVCDKNASPAAPAPHTGHSGPAYAAIDQVLPPDGESNVISTNDLQQTEWGYQLT